MPVEDKRIAQRITREFTRRQSVDASDLRVTVSSGVVYLAGKIKPMKTEAAVDIRKEIAIVEKTLRTIPGIRDVIDDTEIH